MRTFVQGAWGLLLSRLTVLTLAVLTLLALLSLLALLPELRLPELLGGLLAVRRCLLGAVRLRVGLLLTPTLLRRPVRALLAGVGHLLPGRRERVTAPAGTLHAGPRAEGGFEVRARLPLGEAG